MFHSLCGRINSIANLEIKRKMPVFVADFDVGYINSSTPANIERMLLRFLGRGMRGTINSIVHQSKVTSSKSKMTKN